MQPNPFFETDQVAVEASPRPNWWNVTVFSLDSEEGLVVQSFRKLDEANEFARELARVFTSWVD